MRGKKIFVILCMICMLMFGTTAFCEDLDSINQSQNNITQGTTDNQGGTGSDTGGATTDDGAYNSVSDMMRGYQAFDNEDMQKANEIASPIRDIIGVGIGFILTMTVLLVFVTTALDILYIAVPMTRSLLYPGGEAANAGGGMGMGMGMGMRGGMGMGGATATSTRKLISDEAINALASAGNQAAGGTGMGMQGGMGVGVGAGGYGGVGAQEKPKTPIAVYLRKRIFFLILFAIASTLLMSSLFLDCGLNIADLLYKIVDMLNGSLQNVQI